MTWLILLSLIIGKFIGILFMYKLAKRCGFYPPLGIRTRHIYMIGLIASIGLIVAIFVSDVAFSNKQLQGDAKIGALLSAMTAFLCFAIGNCVDYKNEDVAEQEKIQAEP
jgi:Na+:H+ antiporter, NhaA family